MSERESLAEDFYPRSPCGERQIPYQRQIDQKRNFYPRSPCGERPFSVAFVFGFGAISIHALLAESDPLTSWAKTVTTNFYPRSPCGERQVAKRTTDIRPLFLSTLSLRRATLWVLRKVPILGIFLSTLSLRRATPVNFHPETGKGYFYPRSPCGERRVPFRPASHLSKYFYPRSPCGERLNRDIANGQSKKFLSTLSLRRATALTLTAR